jgi:rare lipoprotein A
MQFFGLVWVTSWVSYLLASSQGLSKVPDYLATAFPSKIFSVVNSPIEIPTPLFPTPLYSGIRPSNFSVAAFPNLAFQVGASSFQFQPQLTQASTRSSARVNGSESRFCRPNSEPANNFLPQTTPSSLSVSWEEKPAPAWEEKPTHKSSKATLPEQIFQVIQNLLPWRQRSELTKTLASSVVVMSTHSDDPVTDRPHKEERRVKRGFWRYSQLLASRALAVSSVPTPERFQVWVKGRLIAQFSSQPQAELMAQRLKQFLSDPSDPYLNNLPIQPAMVEGQPAIKVGEHLLYRIDDTLAADVNCNPELLAIEWANNLRLSLGKVPLKLAEAQKQMYNLLDTSRTFTGRASWYGDDFHGRFTATGETYNQHELTAAHPSLPFNTFLKVKNLNNGASVIVRINDRGPYVPNRSLDLSREAARCIGSEKVGVVPFEAVVMQPFSAQSNQYLVRNK